MNRIFEIIKGTRSNFLNLVNGLSLEALNEVPVGFNNNIIWNLGHIISTQQILCYLLTGQKPLVEEQYIAKYKKGTKPEAFIANEELNVLNHYLDSTVEGTVADYKNGLFSNYNPIRTSMGIEIMDFEDAVKAVSMHDGLHLGYAMALRKLVKG